MVKSLNDGAQREGRTPTLLREPDFESGASASSAIRAKPSTGRLVERLSSMSSGRGQLRDPVFLWFQ